MSAALARPVSAASGVVSELAFARAQRNTVLIVDDLFSSRLLLAEIVRQIDGKLNLELFDTPSRALEFARNNRVDIVLTDYKLPEFDGIELVKQLRALPHCVDVPIVVITVVDDRKIRYDALEAGATDFLIKPLDDHETRRALRESARAAPPQDRAVRPGARAAVSGRQVGRGDSRARARDAVQARQGRRVPRQDDGQSPDADGAGTRRSSASAWASATETVHVLEVAAPMHDIGKIGIPDSVLLKEGPLSGEETQVMRDHPRMGYDILKGSPRSTCRWARSSRSAITRSSTDRAIRTDCMAKTFRSSRASWRSADVFDALVSARPYKRAWQPEEGLEFLKSQRGKHFDPTCVERSSPIPRRSRRSFASSRTDKKMGSEL